jgi:hypothetical protein
MTDIPTITERRRPSPRERASIALPDGDFLDPRQQFADRINVCDKTVERMRLPTTYIGGVAHVKRHASLQILADRAVRRNQPPKRRRTA